MKLVPTYILAIFGAIVCLVPFIWTVSTALKTRQQLNSAPTDLVPRSPRLSNRDGSFTPVSVVTVINKPAAVIRVHPIATTRAAATRPVYRTIPVDRELLTWDGKSLRVKLPAAPAPLEADLVEEMPGGVAQVRTNPDGPGESKELFVKPSELTWVVDPQWGNFVPKDWNNLKQRKAAAWTALPLPFHRFVLNTYTVTIISIFGQTLSCSLVAYGFARFSFRGRKALFLLLLSTMMLPAQVTMIPVFLIWNKMHLVDTFAPLTIPAFFAQNAFFVFMLRQFFLGIPRELDEAAMIDGAGPVRIWWQIMLPLSKPALTTVAVLSFIGHWDDFAGPLIYLNSLHNYTVSLALRLFQDQNGTDYNMLMAAALMHILPPVLLFLLAQRYFVKGIAMTGLKT